MDAVIDVHNNNLTPFILLGVCILVILFRKQFNKLDAWITKNKKD